MMMIVNYMILQHVIYVLTSSSSILQTCEVTAQSHTEP